MFDITKPPSRMGWKVPSPVGTPILRAQLYRLPHSSTLWLATSLILQPTTKTFVCVVRCFQKHCSPTHHPTRHRSHSHRHRRPRHHCHSAHPLRRLHPLLPCPSSTACACGLAPQPSRRRLHRRRVRRHHRTPRLLRCRPTSHPYRRRPRHPHWCHHHRRRRHPRHHHHRRHPVRRRRLLGRRHRQGTHPPETHSTLPCKR